METLCLKAQVRLYSSPLNISASMVCSSLSVYLPFLVEEGIFYIDQDNISKPLYVLR